MTSAQVEALEEPKSGWTWLSFGAVMYSIFVFIPAMLYLDLMTGGASLPAAWFTLVLWVEISRLSGRKITNQEATMILILAGAELVIPIGMVYRAWVRTSEIAQLFSMADKIPDWWAPSPVSGAFGQRTFLHPAWVLPIGFLIVSYFMTQITSWSLGIFARKIYVEVERLPFPMQEVSATGITTLVGGEERKLNLLFVFAAIGFIYAFIVYAIPFMTEAWTGQRLVIIPVPWADLTPQLEPYLPGAIFGIATDLAPIAASFVLPLPVIFGIVIGSFAIYFFGNWLTVTQNLAYPWWVPGISAAMGLQRSILYVWAAPTVGIAIVAGIMPILLRPRMLSETFGRFRIKSGENTLKRAAAMESFSLVKAVIIPFLAASVIGISLFIALAPDFPIWFAILSIAIAPIIVTVVAGRMLGETGLGWGGGDIRNLIIYVSGYKGVAAWFVPNMVTLDGTGKLGMLKVADLTRTSTMSLIKGFFVCFPVAIFAGFFFTQIFWSLGPIPSGRYPGAAIFWPINATFLMLWIRGQELGILNPALLLGGGVVGAAIFLLTQFTRIPLSAISLAAGAVTAPPIAMTYIIGLVIRMFLERSMGKEWFNEQKRLLSAGLLVGEAMAVTVSIAISIVINSIWILPA